MSRILSIQFLEDCIPRRRPLSMPRSAKIRCAYLNCRGSCQLPLQTIAGYIRTWLERLSWEHAAANSRARRRGWSKKRFELRIRGSQSRRRLSRHEARRPKLSILVRDAKDCSQQKSSEPSLPRKWILQFIVRRTCQVNQGWRLNSRQSSPERRWMTCWFLSVRVV